MSSKHPSYLDADVGRSAVGDLSAVNKYPITLAANFPEARAALERIEKNADGSHTQDKQRYVRAWNDLIAIIGANPDIAASLKAGEQAIQNVLPELQGAIHGRAVLETDLADLARAVDTTVVMVLQVLIIKIAAAGLVGDDG